MRNEITGQMNGPAYASLYRQLQKRLSAHE